MLLKRLAAIVMALLFVNLAACSSKPSSLDSIYDTHKDTSDNTIHTDSTHTSTNQDTDDLYHDNSKDEIYSDNPSVGDNQNIDNIYQDNDKDETYTDSSANDGQEEGNLPQDSDKDKTPTDDTTTACNHGDEDPYKGMSKAEFYADYTAACCNQDATYRSKHGFLSGSLEIPGQYATESENRPKSNGKFVRNIANVYLDNGNTYIVMDANGVEVMRIHKAGGYITLEEVAAYMYAFGGSGKIPANYVSKKSVKPNSSIWGEYLRVNHSYFKGDTNKYLYEPELPNISGCGGSLQYYEMDIGTTGTVTPGYAAKPYIQGNKINRGAARIVYARQDLNGNGEYEQDEVYVFYTHNHYNDFREYLNYYGGWGEMFGNVTGGGEYSSETKYNPTPYVPTEYADFMQ